MVRSLEAKCCLLILICHVLWEQHGTSEVRNVLRRRLPTQSQEHGLGRWETGASGANTILSGFWSLNQRAGQH